TEAMAAKLYKVNAADFGWIVRADRSDLKGFFRVDEAFPYEQRLTGLSWAALRAIEVGTLTVESIAEYSDADFFARIGIPEEARREKRFSGNDLRSANDSWDECERLAHFLLRSAEAVDYLIRSGLSCSVGTTVSNAPDGATGEQGDARHQATGTVAG